MFVIGLFNSDDDDDGDQERGFEACFEKSEMNTDNKKKHRHTQITTDLERKKTHKHCDDATNTILNKP